MNLAPDSQVAQRTWIKFCGCRNRSDVEAAVEAGADAIGMIFADSPRRMNWEAAREVARHLPEQIEPVAVFVDPSPDDINTARMIFPRLTIQFSGNEPADFVARYGERAIKAIHVDPALDPADIAKASRLYWQALILFDTQHRRLRGGTGKPFPWEHVVEIAQMRPVVVAGGLTPENVTRCIEVVQPYGVDVRSGIETGDRKDPEKMRAFVRAVREADAAIVT